MLRSTTLILLALTVCMLPAQAHPVRPIFDAFEVATVKPVDPDAKSGRFLRMDSANHFVARNYTVQLLLAAAYDLPANAISGGPGWISSAKYEIAAVTPGTVRPTRDEQMFMLRKLLAERFHLTVHRQPKEMGIYTLELAKDGPKLKPSTAHPDDPSNVVCTVYPDHVLLPAVNVAIDDVTRMMQRAILDRPIVDKTGLTGRYDFNLEWAPDSSQFGGEIVPDAGTNSPPLFLAMEQQLGLKLTRGRGPVSTLVVDHLDRPSEN